MLEHLRRLVGHSVVYGMAETISRGTGFVLVFIYGIILTPEDIGLRGAIYTAASFVSIFYTLGLDNSFLRYFMDKSLHDRRHDIFTSSTVFSTVVGILFLTAAFALDGFVSTLLTKDAGYSYLVRLLFIIILFDTVVIYPTLVLRAENRLGYFTLVSFARFVLFIALNLVLVWGMKRGLKGVFEANLAVVLVIALMLIPVYREYFRFRISKAVLHKLFVFGIPTIFTMLCMRIIDYSDKLVILYALGDAGARELGYYNMAYTPGMVGVMVFVNSFRLAWQPFFLSLKDNPDNRNVFSRVATWYAVFIGLVMTGITLFRREIFTVYAPRFPVELSSIVPLVALAYVLFGFYIIMMAGVFIKEKTIFLPVVTFAAAALNLGLNFVFVPAFGIVGAAWTTVAAYTLMVAAMYMVSSRVFHIAYDFRRLATAIAVTVAPILVSFVYDPGNPVVSFAFRLALVAAAVLFYVGGGFLLPDEREYLDRFLKRRLRTG